jgi:hypothetical protein
VSHLPMLGAREAGRLRSDDFHETPEIATRALLSVETFTGPIWEPACGAGAISRVLERTGYRVISSDLVARGYGQPRVDFLMECAPRAPNIVTNPPFKLAAEFARHACALTTGKVAFLCRLGWLEGKERAQMFAALPIARVWVFAGRLPLMHRDGWDGPKSSSAMAFAWFVFDHAHTGAPVIGWLTSPDPIPEPPEDARLRDLFAEPRIGE